jgi:hypothetical protein
MKSAILTISILIQINSFCQEIILGQVNKIPMVDGKVYGYETTREGIIDYIDGLMVSSNNRNVFSLVNGQVKAVFRIDNESAIIIRASDSNFYSYTNLDTTYFSKGEVVKKGCVLGQASENTDKHFFEIEVSIGNKNRFLSQNEIWRIVQKENKNLSTSHNNEFVKY